MDRLLNELDTVVTKVSKAGLHPQGVLRITSSIGLARRQIAPLVSEFAAQYPDLSVQLTFSDREPDTSSERVDVAIVIGRPQDSSLVAKRILRNPCVPCASPAYLSTTPPPRPRGSEGARLPGSRLPGLVQGPVGAGGRRRQAAVGAGQGRADHRQQRDPAPVGPGGARHRHGKPRTSRSR
ncbi:hypothetical protein HML84_05730 [Alcanivorax sp. IO_7]|nr:hypothetical protein HML84_05730 [Alcanivorax sp. IO_7]